MLDQLKNSASTGSLLKQQTNLEQRTERLEIKRKVLRQESNRTLMLDYGMKVQAADADLYIYPSQQQEKSSLKTTSQAVAELMKHKEKTSEVKKKENYAIKENHMDS